MEHEARTAAQIQRELERLGYTVTVVASSAADALAKAAETHPDLVVMDAKRRHAGESKEAAREMRDRFGIPVAYLQLYGRARRKASPTLLDNLRSEIEKELNITVKEALHGRRREPARAWEGAQEPPRLEASPIHDWQWPAAILRAVSDGVVATDRGGTVRFINPVAQELTGWSERDALGRPLALVLGSVPTAPERWKHPGAGDEQAQCGSLETVLVRADGRQTPVEQHVTVIRGEAGTPVGYVYVLHDITERQRIQAERERAEAERADEAKIAAALARMGRELISSLDGSVLLDRLCQVTTEVLECDYSHTVLWRPEDGAYAPVAGYGDPPEQWESIRVVKVPREAISRFIERLDEADVVQVVTVAERGHPLASLLERYGTTVSMYVALRRGTEVIGFQIAGYRGHAAAFTRAQERAAGGIARLASLALENVRLVNELAQANRLKSDFVATMSHELRAPLHVIMGYNDLMLTGEFGILSAEQMTILQRVHDTARQLAEVIQTTLDWSRIETGRILIDRHTTDVRELVDAIDQETQELQQKPAVHFDWRVAPDVPPLETDPVKLKVVLKNLISNAVKFTPEGHVTLSARRLDGGVEFQVADTGIGIAPEARAMIFEPFRQVAADGNGTTRGGVGLGLYIVRRILELLGGSVDVESELGHGATFRVWVPTKFPLVRPEEEASSVS